MVKVIEHKIRRENKEKLERRRKKCSKYKALFLKQVRIERMNMIVDLRMQGYSYVKIAAIFNISSTRVKDILRKSRYYAYT